jgi:hypothetical protein
MAIVPPPPNRAGGPPSVGDTLRRLPLIWILVGILPVLAVLGFGYYWFVQRVEVPANHVLVLVKKLGEPIPATPNAQTQVVLYPALLESLGEAPDSTRYKGILYEVLPEGRYFYDPFPVAA